MNLRTTIRAAAAAALAAAALAGCGGDEGAAPAERPPERPRADRPPPDTGELTVYSGREEDLVEPLFEQYERISGTKLRVRYGTSSELAATLLEEGDRSPADVFFSQDAGALGALAKEDRLAGLPPRLLERVDARFRSAQGRWVGTSGRVRIVAYNRERLTEADLPRSILDFTAARWKGRIGWAPTNASFQSFVTALRVTRGEEAARRFVEGIVDNEPETFENNVAIRDAIARGEIDVGFINHYYVAQAYAEQGPDYPVGIYHPPGRDPGSLVNVAGAAQLAGAENPGGAQRFIDFLLSRRAQRFFSSRTKEYPLIAGARADPALEPLRSIEQPAVDLSDLDDLKGTVRLLEEAGAL